MSVVWLDGTLHERDRAAVSIDDLGFLYGAACFETMRAFGGVVFRLDRHLARLARGLEALGVEVPDASTLAAAITATLQANALTDARIRLTVSAGRGIGRPDISTSAGPTVLVVAEPVPAALPPARLHISTQHVDAARPLAHAKTANYLVSLVALSEARAAGADDALLLGARGAVVEAATSNVFLVTRGEVVTPPLAAGPLPGVTREAVLECADALELRVVERALTRTMLRGADELFVTNSIAGIRPVAAINGLWDASTVPGEITTRLVAEYEALVAREAQHPS